MNKKYTPASFSHLYLICIQSGYEYLIEKGVIDIDINLFRDFMSNKIESLDQINEQDYSKIKNAHVKKSHLICKEFLLELPIDDPKVKVP